MEEVQGRKNGGGTSSGGRGGRNGKGDGRKTMKGTEVAEKERQSKREKDHKAGQGETTRCWGKRRTGLSGDKMQTVWDFGCPKKGRSDRYLGLGLLQEARHLPISGKGQAQTIHTDTAWVLHYPCRLFSVWAASTQTTGKRVSSKRGEVTQQKKLQPFLALSI